LAVVDAAVVDAVGAVGVDADASFADQEVDFGGGGVGIVGDFLQVGGDEIGEFFWPFIVGCFIAAGGEDDLQGLAAEGGGGEGGVGFGEAGPEGVAEGFRRELPGSFISWRWW
jgi:hypothetical protein